MYITVLIRVTILQYNSKIVPYVEMSAAHGSVLTILAISFERYYAICQPLKAGYTCTKVRAMIIILTIWMVALTVTSPVLIFTEYDFESYLDGSMVPVCLTLVQTFWQRIYFFIIVFTFFAIPLFILLIVYTYIARHLMMDTSELSSSSERLQMRARTQVVFMLIAVVLSFFFCLLPFRIFIIYVMLTSSEQLQSLGMEAYYCLLYFCRLMLYTNSALNPILYNVISSKFRESFLRLIGWKVKRHLSHTVSQKFRTSVSGTRSSLISGSTQSSQSGSHVILILSKNSPKKNIKHV
ncbi:growth hormone secretagogue receptor type 1-like [Centruroides sculpturatus]|uniref:growth hormone secretagogue receptor type 1-like n=1 Tax=Centruroides sculpturatus TaxID=218467 RepID=UPI000C6DBF06|nr:growth hormone secretagogue receptor type 1-like [Centruroides sculpturatus]